MNDLDTALRSVARALVDGGPPPPPFPSGTANAVSSSTRRLPRRVAVATAAAAAAVGVVGAAVVVARDGSTRIVASDGEDPTHPSVTRSHPCGADPALRITVPLATDGPTDGRAPRARPLNEGQRAVHWTTAEGSVEVRWPAPTPPVYDDGTAVLSTLSAGEAVSPGRTEIDVAPVVGASDPARRFDPDVVIEPAEPPAPAPTGLCDVVELTVVTKEGRWHSGLKALPSGREFHQPAALVDLQPRIVERRSVDVAPDAATRCQGSDQYGTPPNRAGGADPSISGREPAEVLLGYLASTPGAPQSGYVEMTEPDGSITYGVDPSGAGWTTLVFVTGEGGSHYLEGWTASGC